MRPFAIKSALLCGLLLLAAFPVLAQENDLNRIVINRKPLMDLDAAVSDKLERKEIDLAAAFAVEAAGVLNANGKLDPSKLKYTRAEGDPRMVELARESILAINDSGYLQYLSGIGGKGLYLSIVQDDAVLTMIVQAEVEGPARAKSVKMLLETVLKYYKDKESAPGADGNNDDDLLLINAASITAAGKNIIIKCALSKADAQRLIQKKLVKQNRGPVSP
jgi:hypothetical protein